MINNLHHFEILTNSSSKLMNYFIKGFNFKLVMSREIENNRQHLLHLSSMKFLINSLKDNDEIKKKSGFKKNYETTLKIIESNDKALFDTIKSKNNTVFNAAFRVQDIDRILYNCQK